MDTYLAYIDSNKCKLCRKCVNECPTGAIHIVNMERLAREPKPAAPKVEAPAAVNNGAETKVETTKNE